MANNHHALGRCSGSGNKPIFFVSRIIGNVEVAIRSMSVLMEILSYNRCQVVDNVLFFIGGLWNIQSIYEVWKFGANITSSL